MSRSNSPSPSGRRQFLGAGAALGLAGGLAAVRPLQADPPADKVPDKFRNKKPLKPAPALAVESIPLPPLAARLLNKAAYGPWPGDISAFEALGANDDARLAAWVDYQLNPSGSDPGIDDRLAALLLSAEPADVAAYDSVNKTAEQLWVDHARSSDYATRMRPVWQMERLTILRATYSQWQLREVLFDFWFNHFNIYGREFPGHGMLPEYDRVLRQHLFGNFGDLLNANAKTASMLYYLDNYANTWPRPNENYAREVLELHTLGAIENYYGAVDPDTVGTNSKGQRAGYTEIDVFEFAKALTGWGVSDTTDSSPDTGAFIFRDWRHYNAWNEAPITVMDMVLTETNGEADVTDILDYLAGHYGTARFIAWKLCTRLIGDNPPASIVDSTAEEFYARRNDADQLREVYRHLLLSTEFRDSWGDKVRRPVETVVRAMRGAGLDLTFRIDHNDSNGIWNRLDDTSHYPFGYGPPTGYPDERAMWQGSGPLIMSWRVVTYLLRRFAAVNLAEQTNTGIPLVNDRTPANIVDFWMLRALGYALDAASADRMVQFVTDALGGTANAPINTDTTNTTEFSTYQKIIRGVVGLVLMAPDAMRR